jgi:hypothetical protein
MILVTVRRKLPTCSAVGSFDEGNVIIITSGKCRKREDFYVSICM